MGLPLARRELWDPGSELPSQQPPPCRPLSCMNSLHHCPGTCASEARLLHRTNLQQISPCAPSQGPWGPLEHRYKSLPHAVEVYGTPISGMQTNSSKNWKNQIKSLQWPDKAGAGSWLFLGFSASHAGLRGCLTQIKRSSPGGGWREPMVRTSPANASEDTSSPSKSAVNIHWSAMELENLHRGKTIWWRNLEVLLNLIFLNVIATVEYICLFFPGMIYLFTFQGLIISWVLNIKSILFPKTWLRMPRGILNLIILGNYLALSWKISCSSCENTESKVFSCFVSDKVGALGLLQPTGPPRGTILMHPGLQLHHNWIVRNSQEASKNYSSVSDFESIHISLFIPF